MEFELVGELEELEVIASGTAIRELPRLRRCTARVDGGK
jgi:hypothetical protein